MAKILVAGDALVVKSNITLEEYTLVKKYRPAALKIMGGEDNKDVVFKVDILAKGSGGINTYGATFAKADDDGYATTTILVPEGAKAKEYAEETIGVGILHLNEVEDNLAGVIMEIKAEKESVSDCIEIVE